MEIHGLQVKIHTQFCFGSWLIASWFLQEPCFVFCSHHNEYSELRWNIRINKLQSCLKKNRIGLHHQKSENVNVWTNYYCYQTEVIIQWLFSMFIMCLFRNSILIMLYNNRLSLYNNFICLFLIIGMFYSETTGTNLRQLVQLWDNWYRPELVPNPDRKGWESQHHCYAI